MKAQTFKIVGERVHLVSFAAALNTIGYRYEGGLEDWSVLHIGTENKYCKSAKDFSKFVKVYNNLPSQETFTLPAQYSEALDFAKAQLADELWKEEFKVGEIIKSTLTGTVIKLDQITANDYIGFDKENSRTSGTKSIFIKATLEEIEEYNRVEFKFGEIVKTLAGTLGKITGETGMDYELVLKDGRKFYQLKKYLSKATPQEIEEFNRIDWKVGDLTFNLNVTSKIITMNSKQADLEYFSNGHKMRYWTNLEDLKKPTPEQIEEFNRLTFKKGDILVNSGGYVFKMETEDKTHHKGFQKNGKTGGSIKESTRYATKEEIEEFNKPVYKAGDTIIWLEDYHSQWFLKGDLATIEEVGSEVIHLSAGRVLTGGAWPIDSKQFRLATPEEIKKATEPKDGDIVVGINSNYSFSTSKMGKLRLSNFAYSSANWEIIDRQDRVIFWSNANDNFTDFCRKATKEEIAEFNRPEVPKKGDIVVDKTNSSFIGQAVENPTRDGTHYKIRLKSGELGGGATWDYLSAYYRKATPEEIAEFNKKDYIEMTVGSRNAKIKVYKHKIDIRGSEQTISCIQNAYNHFSRQWSLQPYFLQINDHSARVLLVGCESENNLVSLNEIKAVLDAANGL